MIIHSCGGVPVLCFNCSEKMAVVDLVGAVLVAFALACYVSYCRGQGYPFRNTSLSFEERVKVFIGNCYK
jgi:hypothetical protein